MPGLLAGCVENLLAVYDERRAVFPYTTNLLDGRFVNDCDHPQTIRYSINTLLGLVEAARNDVAGLEQQRVARMVEAFVDRQLVRVETPADLGLLAVLLSECGDGYRATLDHALDGALQAVSGPPQRLNMQDLAWVLWGACAASRRGVPGGERLARSAFELVTSKFVDPVSGLPRHSIRRYRRGIVSFGSLVYFLRSMHEHAATFSDDRAQRLFQRGVETAIDLQGPRGEWPWLLDVRTAVTLDPYPVFSVHQDSMAMLFLLPAHDQGQAATDEAIARSLAWGFGANELAIDFYPRHPFWAYRSIERDERAPRARRYLRSVRYRLRPVPAGFGAARVRLNPECRSYHLGWILFAWAGQPEARGRPQPSPPASRADTPRLSP